MGRAQASKAMALHELTGTASLMPCWSVLGHIGPCAILARAIFIFILN